MSDALTAIGIVLCLVSLWTGIRKVNLSSFQAAFLSIIELVLTGVAVKSLEWGTGLLVVGVTNLLAVLGTSVYIAMQWEDTLAHAATQSGATLDQMKGLAKRLRREHKVFRYVQPRVTAQLIDYVSERGRNIEEVERMAPAIAALWVVHRPDLRQFVEQFDRLLRLWRKPASEAMAVADTLTVSTQRSPATFQEVLDRLIAVVGPFSETRRPASM
jgi:hypothetical protein